MRNNEGILSKLLDNKYIQELGKISYSMYMLHFTVLIYFNAAVNNIDNKFKDLMLIAFLIIIIKISKFTYDKIEEPIIKYYK